MAFLNEDLLRRNGVTQITAQTENTCLDTLGGSYVGFGAGPTKYSVSLELDEAGLVKFSDALAAQENLDDITEFKRELAIMHGVNACEGTTVKEKIDNYLEKTEPRKNNDCVKMTNPYYVIKYKLKHR